MDVRRPGSQPSGSCAVWAVDTSQIEEAGGRLGNFGVRVFRSVDDQIV
jgi:hypothetical protein